MAVGLPVEIIVTGAISAGLSWSFAGGALHMGWWQIDPDTGKPAEGAGSKLSRPPEFTLLNAVPGVDDDEATYYLGDGPWDMAGSAVDELRGLIGVSQHLSDDEARLLFSDRRLPVVMQRLPEESRQAILAIVENMWANVDGCYEDDWERSARPSARCEYAVRQLTGHNS